jgi:hypothetical protein
MEGLAESVRASSSDLDLHVLLRKSPSELLGVSETAAAALKKVGIGTIFDLGTSYLFAAARAATELGRLDRSSARFGLAPGDLLGPDVQFASLDDIASLPLGALRLLSAQQAAELVTALDVKTLRDFAFWPPHRAAARLVGDSVGATGSVEEAEGEELRPRFGQFPTERVYYTTIVMLHMDGQDQSVDLAGPVSLDPAIENPGGFSKPAVGALLTFSQSWYAQGVALGQMLHSLALAPGEATRVAVIDWSRKTQTTASETIAESEQLDNATLHARAVSEVQQAVANDFQQGGSHSSSSSFSQSAGMSAAMGTGFLSSLVMSADTAMTAEEASTTATADSSSWSVGNRSVLGSMTQNVNDRTEQHATSVRNRRASAVREVSQSEHEQISTRIVANYNHMHALTVQYYEVVQVYRVQAELQRADRLLFVPMQLLDFAAPAGIRTVDRFRGALVRAALNRRILSLLLDDTTAVAIKPTATVRVATGRPDLTAAVRSGLAVRVRSAALGPAARAGVLAPAVTPSDAPAPAPAAATTAARQLRVWDERAVAVVARTVDRPVIRVNSDDLHVPDDTELLAISFDGVTIRTVRLDAVAADDAADQNLTVAADAARVDLPRNMRFAELEAIAVAKVDDPAQSGTMTLHCAYLGRRFSLPAVPIELPQGTAPLQVLSFTSDQADRRRELLGHLQQNREYYSQAVYRSLDSATLTMVLSRFRWNGKPLIDQVEPTPLTVAGNFLILRAPVAGDEPAGVANGPGSPKWNELLEGRGLTLGARDQRLIPVPTAGVFAEAVLSRANAAEKLDITRFWNWQDSPIPLAPPDISPVRSGTRATPEDLKPGQLSAPLLNIVNPTSLPDPSGLGTVMNALANLNFRDMSGLAGTQALVQAGMAGTLKAATEAGQIASENLKTEAQKSVAMGQIFADLAKSVMSAMTGVPTGGGGGNVQGISGEGARINHGRDMDQRGIPVPGGNGGNGANLGPPARPGGSAGGGGANGAGGGGTNGGNGTSGSSGGRSHEARAADPAIRAVETAEDIAAQAREAGVAADSLRNFIVEGPDLTAESRAFRPRANDKTGRVTLSVRVPRMPAGTGIRWSVPPSHRGRITLSGDPAVVESVHEGDRVDVIGLVPGLTELDVELRDSGGSVIESVKHRLCVPQFVTVDVDLPAFNGVLTSWRLDTSRDDLLRVAKGVCDLVLGSVNVRTVWLAAPFNETLPSQFRPGGSAAARVTRAVLRGNPPVTARVGQTVAGASGDIGPEFHDESISIFPGGFDDTVPLGSSEDIDEITNQVVQVLTGAPAATTPERIKAIQVMGRLLGETLAHEIGHSLLGDSLGDGFHHPSPGLRDDLMNHGRDRSFQNRSGFEPRELISTGDLSNLVDHGIGTINVPTAITQAQLNTSFPVPPFLA